MSAALVALAGCETMDGFGNFDAFTKAASEADSSSSLDIIERDIEKPEIFTQRDMALWDGRPSFGGVWAALPGNVQPERVSITNVDNGKSVVGALFKREEQNPGPPIRLSSDAAAALGVIPGQPTLVSVTVVRRETFANVPNTPADAVPAEVATETLAPLPGAGAASADQLSEELSSAIEAEPAAPQAPASATPAPTAPVEAAAATAAAAAAATTAAPKKERRSLLDFFRNRRGTDTPAVPQGQVISIIEPEPETLSESLSTPDLQIEAAPLPQAQAQQAPAPTQTAATPRPSAQAPAPTPALSKAYLQTGTFSSRQNAQDQATALDRAGVPAIIRTMTSSSGKTLYRVLAGPAFSAGQQSEFQQAARSLGITDAFPTAK